MIKTFNKFIIAPILINLLINTFINTGSYVTAKAFGLPSYMQVITGEAHAGFFTYANPTECAPVTGSPWQTFPLNVSMSGTGNAVTYWNASELTDTYEGQAVFNSLTSNSFTVSRYFGNLGNDSSNQVGVSSGKLIYTAKIRKTSGSDMSIYYACPYGADWNTYDTDGDGVDNGTEGMPDALDSTVQTGAGPDYCESQSDQLIIEQGKEWNLQPSGLPDKYTTDIGGTLCLFDRISTGIDGTNVTATFQAAAGVGSVEDKPTDFSQFVLRRCDGEILTGTSTSLAWNSLPNQICGTSNYGTCVFELTSQDDTQGNLIATYTGTDSISCDASSEITPQWDNYTESCTDRTNLIYASNGDIWTNDLPQTIGDGVCQYVQQTASCTDGICEVTYTPDGNYTTDQPPLDFDIYTESVVIPDVNQNPNYDYATDSITPLPFNSLASAIDGRDDVCVRALNCSGENCSTDWNSTEVKPLSQVHNEITTHHTQTNQIIHQESTGDVRVCTTYHENGSCANVDIIGTCHAYLLYDENKIDYTPNALGNATSIISISSNQIVDDNLKFNNGDIHRNDFVSGEQNYQGDRQACLATISQFNSPFTYDRATYTYEMLGFQDETGSCDNPVQGDNTEETNTDEASLLQDILDVLSPVSSEEQSAFEQAITPPDDSQVFVELDISEGWEPYDVFGIAIPTTCTPLSLNWPETPVDLGITILTIPSIDYDLDMTTFCDMADSIRELLVLLAWLGGFFIIRANI